MSLCWCLPIFSAAIVVLVGCVINIIIRRFVVKKKQKLPPVYGGWFPWLGCALEFGKSPLEFIEKKRKELGPVFTLRVAGERMTFLTQAADFHQFFQSPNVNFQKAVQNAVQNVASVTEDAFFRNHKKIHDTVKGCLSATNLTVLGHSLYEEFKKHLSEIHKQNEINGASKIELLGVVRSSMYKSVMNNLFGSCVLPTDNEKIFKEVEKKFVQFDDQFEYGARLPHVFIREFSSSKKWLLSLFSEIVPRILKENPKDPSNQTLLETLLSVVDEEFAPNWSLLLLWASLANAVPMTFWTLVFIYSHPKILAKVHAEIEAALKTGERKCSLAQLPYVKQCVLETIRLRSPGIITRRVTKEVAAHGYVIPPGDLLMVSPYWAHRDPDTYPEPDVFRPERWNDMDKNTFPEEFIAFGGGRYQCPGRWFALMEIHLFVAIFVSMFDCKLLNGIPEPCTLHLVGTQQPVQKCSVILTNSKAS